VTVVDAGVRKELDLEVIVPVDDMARLDTSPVAVTTDDPGARSSIWPSIHPALLELVHAHRSTLIFVNSRRLAERLAARLNELEAERLGLVPPGFAGSAASGAEMAAQAGAGHPPLDVDLVRAHHGSIAREQRLDIEDALKAGKLPALVATSSLELGIDMGAIDLVIQVEAPTSVASGLQRIGRAGHQVGQPSRGKIFPKFRGDLVAAAVTVARMKAGLIEETRAPRNPLDVLAQQVVATVASERLTVEELADVVGGAAPFADCSPAVLEGVLDMLSGRYPSDEFAELRPRLTWDRTTGALSPRPGARMVAVTSGGTIPDRGLYGVYTPEGHRVGELDEEMVYESRAGETFLLGATTWRIEEITRDRVVVTPAPGEPGKMPFWHGDQQGRPYELGRAVGAFVREVAAGRWGPERLAAECGLDRRSAENLLAYVEEEREATGGLVPTDRQVVVERFRDELGDWRVCILSPFGARVHAPWALAIEAKVRARLNVDVQCIWSDDGIVVRLPEADDAPPVESVIVDPDEVEELVVSQLASAPVFAARFRENAARALLLPRRRPGSRTPLWQQRQRAADLLAVAARYGEFPILLETYRECLRDAFDLPALTDLMRHIRARTVRIVGVDTPVPSPFAASLAFSYVANFMYEGDSPVAERRAQALTLDRRMLAELLGADELRELIDTEALAGLEAELQHLDPTRHAHGRDGVHDLLLWLGDLTVDEVAARCGRIEDGHRWLRELVDERRLVTVRIAGEDRLVAIEEVARYRDALGIVPPPGVPEALLAPVGDALVSVLRRFARTHCPFVTADAAARYGLTTGRTEQVLRELADQGTLLRGAFRPDGAESEWCDAEVLRRLRQRSLAVLRREIEPADQTALARFLPAWHGVLGESGGLDRLYDVIVQLQGASIPASVLERDVLAARVRDYSPRLLDELCAAGEVVWVGAGPLGRDDGRVMLLLRSEAPALLGGFAPALDRPSDPVHDTLRTLLRDRGACFFSELRGSDDSATLDALWDLVWAGEVTNDSFAPVRAVVGVRGAGRARGSAGPGAAVRAGRPRLRSLTVLGPPRAQGRWSLVQFPPMDPADLTRAAHARAAALLGRHGVLTREAVRAEGTPGGFAGVYPVLRAMEEAGRIRRGYFVAGLGGAQFALPGAVDRLRSYRTPAGDGPARPPSVLVLAATDPCNPYGAALAWPERGPQRVAGAYVVLVDGEASLYLERGGRGLLGLRAFDASWEDAAVTALVGLLHDGRLRRMVLQRYPEQLAEALAAAGFVTTPKGLARYASVTTR
jgi:ATP-dependent Lhr-like helicase